MRAIGLHHDLTAVQVHLNASRATFHVNRVFIIPVSVSGYKPFDLGLEPNLAAALQQKPRRGRTRESHLLT